ncbi:MAG: C40 family peptidase [Armatimonadota bacterium]|nr:C40 family peptidase [Armatimonadota bacterium]
MKVIILTVILVLVVLLAQLPALAGQTITLTLDPPELSDSGSSPPPPAATNHTNTQTTSKTTAKKASDGVAIGRVGVVITQKASIYRSSSSSRVLATCPEGTPLGIVGENSKWYGVLMIDMSTGWVRKSAVKLLEYDLVATNKTSTVAGGVGQQIVQAAMKYTGVPYVWGGNSWNGLDCSGFVKSVYGNFGVNLPRVSREQANVGVPVGPGDLQAGDRLYFACKGPEIDHTGIYIGNGLFIHASSRRGGVAVDNLASGFYGRTLISARRS